MQTPSRRSSQTIRDLDAWASWAGIAARTLSRRFVTETGFTFTAWRQRARLLRSLEMLAESTPVTTVALDLGYDSVSAFIALFRRTFGVTPGEYMRNATEQGRNQNHFFHLKYRYGKTADTIIAINAAG